LLAFDNQELIGTVCLKVHDMDTRPDLSPWLAGLYVVAPWRRLGIGAKLVAVIEKKPTNSGWNSSICTHQHPKLFIRNLDGKLKKDHSTMVILSASCRKKLNGQEYR